MTIKELVKENKRRMDAMYIDFNPLTGEGSPLDRKEIYISDFHIPTQHVPVAMLENKLINDIVELGSIEEFIRSSDDLEDSFALREYISKKLIKIRSKYDFCFWAYFCGRIKPKSGGDEIPFKLRHEQRILLVELEGMRLAGKPIRVILLKARQWGGSTLVQIYIAWIQLIHKTGWYSTIIAQDLGTSRKIKGMYSRLLKSYPSWMLDIEDASIDFSPYQGSTNDFQVTYKKGGVNEIARDSVITVGTYENPDATRGGDVALVHYSEVGIWKATKGKKPEDVIRSVSGGLLIAPLTLEVLESTANGTGNYFHEEWERAKSGKSSRKAVFIPWYFIEHDSLKLTESEEHFAKWLYENRENKATTENWLDEGRYYWSLWEKGATFAGINWYRHKRKDFNDHADMASEAPSDDIEAFKHSGDKVYDIYLIDKLRKGCKPPIAVGDVSSNKEQTGKDCIKELKFHEDKRGLLKIWDYPDIDPTIKRRYCVSVDIGGTHKTSDYSVITVLDRFYTTMGGSIETVARWVGHIDPDLLAWKAMQIAEYYDKALLVFEVNTYDKRKNQDGSIESDHSEFILSKVGNVYANLYARKSNEQDIREGKPRKWGYHTNKLTKPKLIDNSLVCLRDELWIERDNECCNEFSWYEKKEDGTFGAIDKHHDDILMSTVIGLEVAINEMDPCVIVERTALSGVRKIKHGGAATF